MENSFLTQPAFGKWLCCLLLCLLCSRSTEAKVLFVEADQTAVAVNATNEHYLRYVRHMTVPIASQTGDVWTAGNDITTKTPEEIEQIVSDIKALEDSIQKQIFERMQQSTEDFKFKSIALARNVVIHRLETMAMMQKFNGGVYGYSRDNPANPGYASTSATAYWSPGRKPNPDFYFFQKNGTAYEAINALCADDARTYGECLGAMFACVWWGASQGMGEAAFNATYPGSRGLDMDIDGRAASPNLWRAQDTNTVVPGDVVYFKNHNYGVFFNFDDKGYADPRIIELWMPGWSVARRGRNPNDPTQPPLLGRDPNDISKPRDAAHAYLFQGENAFYMGIEDGLPTYEGLGVPKVTEEGMRKELQDAYNLDLNHVIAYFKAVYNPTGEKNADGSEKAITWNGVDVTEMTDEDIREQITLVIDRVGHDTE